MTTDLVVGWIYDEKIEREKQGGRWISASNNFDNDLGLRIWSRSLTETGYRGERLLFYDNVNASLLGFLRDEGFRLVEYGHDIDYGDGRIGSGHSRRLARWHFLWGFLAKERQRYRFVIHTDCTDVVFQEEPTRWLASTYREPFVALACEGAHRLEEWTATIWREHQKGFAGPTRNLDDAQSICCGVVAGTPKELQYCSLAWWAHGLGSGAMFADQSSINYLWPELEMDPQIHLLHPANDRFALHWWAIPRMLAGDSSPIYRDGIYYHRPSGLPYVISHQYNWAPECEDILAHWRRRL